MSFAPYIAANREVPQAERTRCRTVLSLASARSKPPSTTRSSLMRPASSRYISHQQKNKNTDKKQNEWVGKKTRNKTNEKDKQHEKESQKSEQEGRRKRFLHRTSKNEQNEEKYLFLKRERRRNFARRQLLWGILGCNPLLCFVVAIIHTRTCCWFEPH